jgi:hypothetical protein
METIRIYVTKNVATCERRTAIVCGNTDYQIEFVLDDEWSAYPNRMARFIWNGQYQDVSFTGNTCMMPPVYNTEKCYVGLIAEGYQQITTAAVISCKKSVKCIEQQPSTEQFIHDVLNTDVPNDADDELSRFLENISNSILEKEGADVQLMNPQDFSARIANLSSSPFEHDARITATDGTTLSQTSITLSKGNYLFTWTRSDYRDQIFLSSNGNFEFIHGDNSGNFRTEICIDGTFATLIAHDEVELLLRLSSFSAAAGTDYLDIYKIG